VDLNERWLQATNASLAAAAAGEADGEGRIAALEAKASRS